MGPQVVLSPLQVALLPRVDTRSSFEPQATMLHKIGPTAWLRHGLNLTVLMSLFQSSDPPDSLLFLA